jgi:tetratricopeptide (TPR) repeat protein
VSSPHRSQYIGNIGLIYWTKGDLDKALKYHEEALKLDREMGNKQGEAQDLGNIGLIYAKKGNKEKALNYYNQSLALFKQIGAQREIQIVENNIRIIKEQTK